MSWLVQFVIQELHGHDAPDVAEHLDRYLEELSKHLRDKRQRASFAMYALGLLTEGERKSMDPIAPRACGAPEQTNAQWFRTSSPSIYACEGYRLPTDAEREYAARAGTTERVLQRPDHRARDDGLHGGRGPAEDRLVLLHSRATPIPSGSSTPTRGASSTWRATRSSG